MAAANRTIALLGAGKIGESLLAGLLSSGWRSPEEIVATGRREERLREVAGRHGVRVPERAMDAVTAVSGSGPAYFALLAEGMIEAGILLGLSREVSTQLVVQTMLGTARLLRDERIHPVELREGVTSPGGTTPGKAYARAARLEPDWSGVELWWGDERGVPPDDERSNYRLAKQTLL